MSNDPMAVSDIRDQPLGAAQTSLNRGLTELLAALNHIAAEFAASATPTDSGLDAAERIQDVAFALRERGVDAVLGDALDAAAREISSVCAFNDAAAARARKAANLLRSLAGCVNDMIALSIAAETHAEMDADNFARAFAMLAATLPTFADDFEPTHRGYFDNHASESLLSERVSAASTEPAPIEVPPREVVMNERPGSETDFALSSSNDAGDRESRVHVFVNFAEGQQAGQNTSQEFPAEAAAVELTSSAPFGDQKATPTTPVAGHVAPARSDPLAAAYALSEEEIIALFS
jgi:hypothetical protein